MILNLAVERIFFKQHMARQSEHFYNNMILFLADNSLFTVSKIEVYPLMTHNTSYNNKIVLSAQISELLPTPC